MLAKELKIKTIKKQRLFIENALRNRMLSGDGDTSYSYIGYIYPENVKYFEENGFMITLRNSERILAAHNGMPVNYISISDNLTLTEEEAKEAEEYAADDVKVDCEECGGMPGILGAIIGIGT